MTLTEINNLTMNDVIEILLQRVLDYSVLGDGDQPYILDPLVDENDVRTFLQRVSFNTKLIIPVDLEAQLNAEFLVYQQELLNEENARLAEIARMQDLKDRVKALKDINRTHFNLNPDIPNVTLWIKENIYEADPTSAENNLQALETEDANVKTAKDAQVVIDNKVATGQFVRKVCSYILDLVIGNNKEKNLTEAQLNQMEVDYANVFKHLQNYRPIDAKNAIVAMSPDGTLVTQADKDEYLAGFAKFGL